MEKISIIIPAYNEEKRIGKTLEAYLDFFKKKKLEKDVGDFEIIVVLNDCVDGTRGVVEKYKCRELKVLEFKRGGKGFAIIEGFKEALKKDFNLIGFVDADMSTSPESFYDLIVNIKGYDGILASRYVKGAVLSPKQPFRRIFVSRFGNFIIRSLFLMPYRDTQCGAKLFKKHAIKKVLIEIGITEWAFDIDLLYRLRKNKFKMREIPTIWSDKDESKLNLKKGSIRVLFAITQLRIINSPFKRFLRYIKSPVKFLWVMLRK